VIIEPDRPVTLGALVLCTTPPEQLPDTARRVERLGFDELWVVEDCFFAGAVGAAAVALASTERIRVGVGVLPAVLRNPAVAAMEIAGLARIFPGRLLPGFGHGIASWMRQVGAFPASQLAALRETIGAVRALLAGQRVDLDGQHVRFDGVQLDQAPTVVPPVFAGVRGARSLVLSGEVADGTVLGDMSSPGFVAWARTRIDEGRRAASRAERHRLTVYVLLDISHDRTETRRRIAAALTTGGPAPGIGDDLADEVDALLATTEPTALASVLPDAYIDQLCVSGSPAACAARIEDWHRAGADALVLVPSEDAERAAAQLEQFARDVLPLLRH
jgi:5,10-methylenetetrahydromethanopterin reductase